MSPKPIECWESIVKSGDLNLLESLLADGVVFESPVVHTPQVGRRLAKTYLGAAVKALRSPEFHFVSRWIGDRSAVLEFETQLDGLAVNGVDIIRWNADDQITHFKVMVRPSKAMSAVQSAVSRQLQA
jgi:hypothetical protein